MAIKYAVVLAVILSIACVGLFMAWVRSKNEIEGLESELSKLRHQHKKFKDEVLERSIQEKASAWRRDRRQSDFQGYDVTHED